MQHAYEKCATEARELEILSLELLVNLETKASQLEDAKKTILQLEYTVESLENRLSSVNDTAECPPATTETDRYGNTAHLSTVGPTRSKCMKSKKSTKIYRKRW